MLLVLASISELEGGKYPVICDARASGTISANARRRPGVVVGGARGTWHTRCQGVVGATLAQLHPVSLREQCILRKSHLSNLFFFPCELVMDNMDTFRVQRTKLWSALPIVCRWRWLCCLGATARIGGTRPHGPFCLRRWRLEARLFFPFFF